MENSEKPIKDRNRSSDIEKILTLMADEKHLPNFSLPEIHKELGVSERYRLGKEYVLRLMLSLSKEEEVRTTPGTEMGYTLTNRYQN